MPWAGANRNGAAQQKLPFQLSNMLRAARCWIDGLSWSAFVKHKPKSLPHSHAFMELLVSLARCLLLNVIHSPESVSADSLLHKPWG